MFLSKLVFTHAMNNLKYVSLQYALPHLRKTQGNIINDGSLVAHIGQMEAVTYVATKVSC